MPKPEVVDRFKKQLYYFSTITGSISGGPGYCAMVAFVAFMAVLFWVFLSIPNTGGAVKKMSFCLAMMALFIGFGIVSRAITLLFI